MNHYNPKNIEDKWAKVWGETKAFKAEGVDSLKPKVHVLDMFPYPSGEGLHIGHAKVFTASDVYARFKRMQGYNVLHTTGWDAFGLPAEQYALKNKVHPKDTTKKNTDTFRRQMKLLGLSYDWDREINTTDPNFYKWTQWIFLQLWNKGLVKEVYEPINWCPSCKTGLANEDLEGNACERCGTIVEKKPLRQFSIEITKYAEKLLDGLNDLDWKENVKDLERNWIGKSEGAEIEFDLKKAGTPLRPEYTDDVQPPKEDLKVTNRKGVMILIKHWSEEKYLLNISEKFNWKILFTGGVEEGESVYEAARREVVEETGYKNIKSVSKSNFSHTDNFQRVHKGDNARVEQTNMIVELLDGEQVERSEEEMLAHKLEWHTREEMLDLINRRNHKFVFNYITTGDYSDFENVFIGYKKEDFFYVNQKFTIFTTRPDTLFGCTYCVMAPEHALVSEMLAAGQIENKEEVEKYIEEVKLKTEIERSAEGREKTGVELKGVKAVNPANNEEVPVFIADYVLASYGTGAIMAVPAHDERDFEFAKKYNIDIKPVILSSDKSYSFIMGTDKINEIDLQNLGCDILEKTESGFFKVSFPFSTIENYKKFIIERMTLGFWNEFSYQKGFYFIFKHKDGSIEEFELNDKTNNKIDEYGMTFNGESPKEVPENVYSWLAKNSLYKTILYSSNYGRLINSGKFDGMESEEAKKAITEFVGGKMVTKYKLRDWVFARQRYWGEPFPLVHVMEKNEKGEEVKKIYPVDESDLPVVLPDVKDYEPTGTGESPLANIEEWVNVEGYITDEGAFSTLQGVHSDRELRTIQTYQENVEVYDRETPNDLQEGEHKEELDLLVKYLKGGKVLEIGSGTGRDALYLSKNGVDVEATDIVEEFKGLIESKSLNFKKLDPVTDGFGQNHYDGVLAIASLLHCERFNFIKIIKKINLSLRDNGCIYLRLKTGEGERSEISKGGYRFFVYHTIESVSKILSENGFEVVHTKDLSQGEKDLKFTILAKKKSDITLVKAKRETNTMPQWAGSSWYWLRYMDPMNSERFVGRDEEKYWGQVDVYLGGLEHATRHLIYGRFWHRFLYDIGELTTPEPFKRLEAVGLVLGEGGVKMSKRLGNVINPDDVAGQWGVDTLRTYILFMGPYHDSVAWNSKNLIGPRRFLERVWTMRYELGEGELSKETDILLNQTIKKLTEDNEALRFNTGVSALMILFNALEKETVSKENYLTFLKLLAPYAPFMTEEIWQSLGQSGSIHHSSWPTFDVYKLESASVTIAVQYNGKVRDTVEVPNNATQEEVERVIKSSASYTKWVGDKEIKKVIFVSNKIINLIV